MTHALESLGKREIRDLFSKGWITHDAMWFAHCLEAVGIEKTNALNRAAVRAMASVEILRLKKLLRVEEETFENFESLAPFLKQAMEIVLADFMRVKFNLSEKNVISWKMEAESCFAYRGMCRLGMADRYECGVLLRVESWLATLKVPYTIHPPVRRCLMHLDGKCEGRFQLG